MKKLETYILNSSPEKLEHILGVYRKLPIGVKQALRRLMALRLGKKQQQTPVSCICPTYGRTDLLEEAIYSFLNQDYQGPKELVILNDYERQTLVFDHPEVRIVNFPKRLHTLGEKFKAAVGLCSYDLVCVWHDDDIYLPHRLSYVVKQLHKHIFEYRPNFNLSRHKAFFRADKAWVWNGQGLSGPKSGRFHGGSSWNRKQFASVRGYAHINFGYDEELETQFERDPEPMIIDDISPADTYYIYRRGGTNSYHLSDFAGDGAGDEYDKVATFVQNQADRGEIKLGRIMLEPRWQIDYTTLVRDYLRDGRVESAGK